MREMAADDYEAVHALYKEPGALDYMESFFTGEDEEGFFESYVNNMYRFYDFGMYVVQEKEAGRIVGHVGLGIMEGTDGEPSVTLGYIISESYRRKGTALWACQKVLDYAKDSLYLDKVEIRIHPMNGASMALGKKLEKEYPGFAAVLPLFLANSR